MHDHAPAFIWRRSLELYVYPGPARLVSWSEVQAPLSGHEAYAPYIVAIVSLADGTHRTAQIVDCTAAELAVDLELMPVFRRIYDAGPTAPIVYGYKFTPAHP
jgi:uncharacterized OB-fold protein